MILRYFGHACFKLEIEGIKCIFDPYKSGCFGGALRYEPLNVKADIVLISHFHEDHCAVSEVGGNPEVINKAGSYKFGEISITGIKSYHDDSLGRQRGENIVFIVSTASFSLAHLGDQGCIDEDLISKLEPVDILLMPVGGTYTLGPEEATKFINFFNRPKIIIPMHYKTEKVDFPIKPVEDFLKLNRDIPQKTVDSILTLDSVLPVEGTEIVVMQHGN